MTKTEVDGMFLVVDLDNEEAHAFFETEEGAVGG